MVGSIAQVLGCLPGNIDTLSSNSDTAKTKNCIQLNHFSKVH
jgi:hypothetical protein